MSEIKVVIVEDKPEELAHLKKMLAENTLADFQVIKELNSKQEAVTYFNSNSTTDLIFMDIQLPDGLSFDIFNQVDLKIPIIFTSSYEHYALQAIKLNGVDYLLKPVNEADLNGAITNFLKTRQQSKGFELEEIRAIVSSFMPKSYKSSFLVNYKHKMLLIDVSKVAYFYVKEKGTYLVTATGEEYLLDYYLDQLEEELDPTKFYRINRQYLIAKSAIRSIENYFNGRLLITVSPKIKDEVILSRKKVTDFKNWADQ